MLNVNAFSLKDSYLGIDFNVTHRVAGYAGITLGDLMTIRCYCFI